MFYRIRTCKPGRHVLRHKLAINCQRHPICLLTRPRLQQISHFSVKRVRRGSLCISEHNFGTGLGRIIPGFAPGTFGDFLGVYLKKTDPCQFSLVGMLLRVLLVLLRAIVDHTPIRSEQIKIAGTSVPDKSYLLQRIGKQGRD
jgi:hypothetical protein